MGRRPGSAATPLAQDALIAIAVTYPNPVSGVPPRPPARSPVRVIVRRACVYDVYARNDGALWIGGAVTMQTAAAPAAAAATAAAATATAAPAAAAPATAAPVAAMKKAPKQLPAPHSDFYQLADVLAGEEEA